MIRGLLTLALFASAFAQMPQPTQPPSPDDPPGFKYGCNLSKDECDAVKARLRAAHANHPQARKAPVVDCDAEVVVNNQHKRFRDAFPEKCTAK